MWPALIPLLLAIVSLVAGVRAAFHDARLRNWVWLAFGIIATISGTIALVLVANLYAAAAAGL